MPDTPTPGQIAYAAFMRASLPSLREQEAIMPWDSPLFLASERAAWDAAAQAVLEACAMLCPICGAELERCNAKDTP